MRRKGFSLSSSEARRAVLAAQGFLPKATAEPRLREIRAAVKRLGLLQIDSVNVLVRAHFMPLFSRFGRYSRAHLDELSYRRGKRTLFEYWGHEASLISLHLFPFFRWRMRRAAEGLGIYSALARLPREKPGFIDLVMAEVRDRGPISAGQLQRILSTEAPRKAGSWWGWSDHKRALEWLFWTGKITTAFRRNFERVYDLTDRVLPRELVCAPEMPQEDAQRELVRVAARALGVATESDLRDYFRLGVHDTRARLAELVAAGELVSGEVENWSRPAFAPANLRIPRNANATAALLSPFDPLVWERSRTERLFRFRYRIEIYTPPARRQHGYYVLPFLHRDELAGRVDLKAERARSALLVQSSHAEHRTGLLTVAESLFAELRNLADWLELDSIEVRDRGNLAGELRQVAAKGRGSR